MKKEIAQRKRAIALHLQGGPKSAIARKLQRSRSWVQRWMGRYRPDEPTVSPQDHSRAPKQRNWMYPERIKRMVLQIRVARERGKRAKYQYALIGAQAIYYELRALQVFPLSSPRTIHSWLKQAGQIAQRKARKGPNLTYPGLLCKAVNDVHELDFKGPFYLQDHAHKYYLVALRDKWSEKTALRALANKSMGAILDFLVSAWQKLAGTAKRSRKKSNQQNFKSLGSQPLTLQVIGSRLGWERGLAIETEKTQSHEKAQKTRRVPHLHDPGVVCWGSTACIVGLHCLE